MPAQTPEEVDALFEKGMNAGDPEAVAALYEEDAVLVAQPGQIVQGRDAILEALQRIVAGGMSFKLNVTKTMTAGDTAVLYNEWTASARNPDGAGQDFGGKAIEIVRRQADGTWLFAIDDPFARG
jgi:uncharacterized protein (TIGR02246 family)